MQEQHSVLIVDDDPMQRRFLQIALHQEEYKIYEAADGLECLAAVQKYQPDIVIMDVKMPRLDGIEACSRLRTMEENQDLPIVLITVLGDAAAIREGFMAGATDYLAKPVNVLLFGHRIKALLQARQMQSELQHNRENYIHLQQELGLGYWTWDLGTDQLSWSESLAQQFGLTVAEVEPSRAGFLESIHCDDRKQLEEKTRQALEKKESFSTSYRVFWPDGTVRTLYDQVEIVLDEEGKAITVSGQVKDISEHTETRKQIARMYYYDTLTGLPNKMLFNEKLERLLHRIEQRNAKLTVLSVGLDRFDNVYESLGKLDGDRVLQLLSKRIASTLQQHIHVIDCQKKESIMARFHGARFMVVCTMSHETPCNINILTDAILADISNIVELNEQELMLSGSIGISRYPDDGNSAERLTKNAECAMERARSAGGGQVYSYSSEMNALSSEHFTLESDIRKGLERDEFLLHYQPQIELSSGRVVGVEALSRWEHPTQGMVPPGKFITLCENTGLILPLSYQVLQSACRQQSVWRTKGIEDLRIAVNISCKQVNDKAFATKILRFFDEINVDPALFDLEVTESCLMFQEEHLMQSLGMLKDQGMRIAIDDFGTGYSSLAYLESLPIDVLKIDRMFTRGITTGKTAIINAILDMAKSLGLETVAEGVECKEELDYMKEKGADIIQGFLFSRPMPADEIPEFILNWKIDEHW